MRYNIISALATAALVVCASCSKENPAPEETTAVSGRFEVTIRGEMTDFASDTKASAVSGMRMQWAEGDAVWAYGTVESELSLLGKLTVTIENDNNYVAVMNGTLSSAPSGGRLYLVHSSLNTTEQPGLGGNVLTIDMSDQPSDMIPFIAYATVDGVTESAAAGLKAVFSFATSVLKVNIRNLAVDAVLTSALVSDIETNCTLTLNTSDGTFGIGNDGTAGTISKFLSGTASQGKTCFYVSVPCFAASTKRILTITANGESFYTYNVFPDARAANKYVNYVYKAGKGPEGAIIAPYTVSSSGTEVFFSRGNLYYDSSAGSLKFESDQHLSTPLSEGAYDATHVSHFRWAWKTSNLSDDLARSMSTGDYSQSQCDVFFTNDTWTTPREDLTVEGTTGVWRTLSRDEWNYLLNTRKVIVGGESKTPYGEGSVEGMNGLIVLPDDWDGSTYDGSGSSFTYGASAFSNTFTESTNPSWSAMEEAGCVFLPAAGRRTRSTVGGQLSSGYYWSSTTDNLLRAYDINFFSNLIYSNSGNKDLMDYGNSVRMVCAVL